MPTVDHADMQAVAQAFIARGAEFPAPTEPAAARYIAAVARMTPAESEQTFQQFMETVKGLPGGAQLLESARSIN